jgi:hypothetical protein
MALRPVFIPDPESKSLVREARISFQWRSGLSTAQKQKSIRSLHGAASAELGIPGEKILEISSKSEQETGRRLSAFVLELDLPDGIRSTVECAFQGSKRFRDGGPYTDLYGLDSRAAKRDARLRSSGPLQTFSFFGEEWPLDSGTAFYDWLYLSTLQKNNRLAQETAAFEAFTDIEFNPSKSINCQANSAARFVAMAKRGVLGALAQKSQFLSLYS